MQGSRALLPQPGGGDGVLAGPHDPMRPTAIQGGRSTARTLTAATRLGRQCGPSGYVRSCEGGLTLDRPAALPSGVTGVARGLARSSMDVPRPAPRGCLTEIDSPPFTTVCSGNTVSLRNEKYGPSGRHFDRVGRFLRLCVDPGSVAEGREREGQTSRALERAVYTAQLTRRSLPTSRAKSRSRTFEGGPPGGGGWPQGLLPQPGGFEGLRLTSGYQAFWGEAGSEPTAKTAQKRVNVSRRPSVARRGRSRSARESPD